MRKLRVLLAVQGDGRGHLTQALAVQRLLREAGHEIPAILVGRNPEQTMPEFFSRQSIAPIIRIDSFAFVTDKTNTTIAPWPTMVSNLRNARRYWHSIRLIRETIIEHRPDVVLNFFEPLVGFCYLVHRPAVALVCLGNQYMFHHPDYSFPKRKLVDRFMVKFWSRVTAIGARRLLALSLIRRQNFPSGLVTTPPLLRPEVLAMTEPTREGFLLIYLLKAGFREQIIAWHRRHPEVELHCFTDQPQEADAVAYDSTLTFHKIDDVKFLDLMARCSGFVATGGFQTLCEAMYLGKPILVVPVGNHFEQSCNATQAEAIGAGLGADQFDLDRFMAYLPTHASDASEFRAWVADTPVRLLSTLEQAAALNSRRAL